MSCGVGRRCGLDPTLLWLWCRLAATALIRPLAWEPPYTVEAALEKAKRQKKKKKKRKNRKSQFLEQEPKENIHLQMPSYTWTFLSGCGCEALAGPLLICLVG